MKNKNNIGLIIIDVQEAWNDLNYWKAKRNNPDAEKNMKILLDRWRKMGLPIIYFKHSSSNVNSPLNKNNAGHEIQDIVKPLETETVIEKKENSAFIGTNLESRLGELGISDIVLIGITTNHCISSTARMAGNLGFNCTVVSDATYAFDRIGPNGVYYDAETMHNTTLANLQDEFANVLSTNDFLEQNEFV